MLVKSLLIASIALLYCVIVFINLPLEKLCVETLVCLQETITIVLCTMAAVGSVFFFIGLLLAIGYTTI